jgi:hypothetical protein
MTRVFLSTWGQNDNIGDSILRRGLLRSFQGIDGAELHVHVGRGDLSQINDDDYLTALGLRGDEILYDTNDAWLRAASTKLLAERTILVLPAGEVSFPEHANSFTGWRSLLGVLGARVRRGAGVQVGAGVRMSSVGDQATPGQRVHHTTVGVPLFERLARRPMAVVAWRDADSRDAFRVGDVVPDWAFGEGPDPSDHGLGAPPAKRTRMALTTRWDREILAPDKIRLLRQLAEARGLEIQVYSQVRRDRGHMEKLAHLLHPGTEPVLFGGETHAEWEAIVRGMFRECAVVASDRLHALVVGATEGAIPLGISNWTTEKVVRTLSPAGFSLPIEATDPINRHLDECLADDDWVVRPIIAARATLDGVRARLRALVEGRKRS